MNKEIKLLIAVPTLDYIHRKFVESLTGLTKYLESNGPEFDVHFEGCTLVYISRDNIVKKAMEEAEREAAIQREKDRIEAEQLEREAAEHRQ